MWEADPTIGRIGKLLTARARAFGMQVIAYDPYIAPNVFESAGAQRVTLDELSMLAMNNSPSANVINVPRNTRFFIAILPPPVSRT